MDFIDQTKELSNTVSKRLKHVEAEEGTKNALVMPFIRTLGYDVFNPEEVKPEYTCDDPAKKGEKVDYAIMKDGKPFMLLNANLRTTIYKVNTLLNFVDILIHFLN